MDQKYFNSFFGQLKNHLPVKNWMHMKHCCTPKTTVSSMGFRKRKTLVLGYHLHRETQYFHLHRETIFPRREIPEALF